MASCLTHRTLRLSWLSALLLVGLALASPAQAASPTVGAAAPDFSLPDQSGKTRSLQEFRGKWLVLYFYPKNDTPGCTTEACSFRDGHALIAAQGAQVLGVSVDDSASHLAFSKKYKLPFPLLADTKGEVAQRYGALSDWKVVSFAQRQTFLIDAEGVLRKAYLTVNPDSHVAEVLADLKQLTRPSAQ